MSINEENRITDRSHNGRRRLLLGCSIALAVALVVAGVAWWAVSRYLGDMLSGIVREQAAQAINGRLEFDKLVVDLAGHAVLTDAAVYPEDGQEPWLSCPRTVVGFDLFNLIGPNRGKRAITVTLHQPHVKLEREPDGRFNLERLIKQREQEREPLGLALTLRDAEVDFTDWCLLDQAYPQLSIGEGLGAQLLGELGYDPRGGGEVAVHQELLGVSGSIAINQQREELSFNARIVREQPGGSVAATGTAKLDGATFDIRLTVEDAELASGRSYLQALFPDLALAEVAAADMSAQPSPFIASRITRARLHLQTRPGEEASVSGEAEMADLSFDSSSLPRLYFPQLQLAYDSAKGRLETDIELQVLECLASGNVEIDTAGEALSGKLVVSCPDPGRLATQLDAGELPVRGAVSAQLELGGSPASPQVTAQLNSDVLFYEKLKLGRLGGTARLSGSLLELEGVKLSGGEAQLTADGSYELREASGSFEARVGPLPAAQALDLAARIKPNASLPDAEVSGSLSAAVDLTVAPAGTRTALRVWSESLTVAGQQFKAVDIKGVLSPPNINIEEAVAQYISSEPFNLASFSSDGPLKVSLRAGGSVSSVPGQSQPALAIVGEGNTVNLKPEQAHISFKALGPANDPELRLQVKTTHAAEPLLLRAQGHYREGFAPATASLSWQDTTVDFSGQVDISGQRIDGKLTAANVDLQRFSGNQQLSGKLSLEADAGGTFSQPSLKGNLTVPWVALETDWRRYGVRDASTDFELVEGNAISVNNGSFVFEENQFTIAGRLGQAGSRLSINCANFNLFSVLAMVQPPAPSDGAKTAPNRPPLEIESSGPLNIILTGDLSDPRAELQYTSSAGQVEGHRFSSAVLTATATRERAEISKFNISSEAGSLALTGNLVYQPVSYSADATISSFDVGILTALIDSRLVGSLDGTLNGRVQLSGGRDSYRADGNLTLSNGEYNGMAVSEARASFNSSDNTTSITEGVVVADGRVDVLEGEITYQPLSYALEAQFQRFNIEAITPFLENKYARDLAGSFDGEVKLTGDGREHTVDITKAVFTGQNTRLAGEAHLDPNPANTRLEVYEGSSLDLALISPLLPDDVPPLSGKLEISVLELTPSGSKYRYPNLELSTRSEGQISAGTIRFDSIKASVTIEDDKLHIKQPSEVRTGQSILELQADGINLAAIDSRQGGTALPLDFSVSCTDFDLDDVAALLPQDIRRMVPGGVFTCENLKVGGTTANPSIDGEVTFDITRMPAYSPYLALVSHATGEIDFNPEGITIDRLRITPAGGSGAQGTAEINGGPFSLYPFQLTGNAMVTLRLGGDGYMYVNTYEVDMADLGDVQLPLNFEGWVSGNIDLTPGDASDQRPVISGTIVVNEEGKNSLITMERPQGESQESQPAPFRFGQQGGQSGLGIVINNGTEFRFDRGSNPANLDLRAELITPPQGEGGNELRRITLRGVPGLLEKNIDDSLDIDGEVLLTRGSLRIYRHIVRLEGGNNRVKFEDTPGEIYPYLYASATLELPRVLSGNETFISTGADVGTNGSGRSNRDLLIFISLVKYPLGPTVYTCPDHTWVEESEGGKCQVERSKAGKTEKCGNDLIPKGLMDSLELDSEPQLPDEQILAYLVGDVVNVLTGSGSLSQFAEEELQAFGASFISRYIEEQLDLAAFRVGGTGDADNPYFMDLEKEVTPGFSVTYYRDFFSQTYQSEEYGVKYRILEEISGNRYNNVDLEVNFTEGGFRGTGSEFMFTWNTRF